MASGRLACFAVLLLSLGAGAQEAEDSSCAQADETPLLQVHSARGEAAKRSRQLPKMPVNGPGVPPRNKTAPTGTTTNVEVHNTIVVIPGNVIIGENVTAGSGNIQNTNISNQLKSVLKDAADAASSSAASTAAKAAKEIEKSKIELPRFVTDNKKIWLQDEDGKHLLVRDPSGACTACGCFYDFDGKPSKYGNYDVVTKEDLDDMPNGDNFSCEKYMPPISMLQEMGMILTREGLRAAHEGK